MKKFEITKEQLKGLIEASVCNIKDYVMNNDGFIDDWMKEEFPEAFKKKLIIGKWYKVTNIADGSLGFDGIGQYTLDKNDSGLRDHQYGFNFKQANGRIWRTNGYISEAAPQEIETALINEAKKRGFKDGNYECLSIVRKTHKHNNDYIFDLEDNILFTGWNEKDQRNIVFKDGKWATIIETITIQEAEKLLNKKIV